MKTKLTKKMWMLIHGELGEQEAQQLVAEVSRDEDLVKAFHARNELDLALAEALGQQEDALSEHHTAGPTRIMLKRGESRAIPFPFLRTVTRIAAAVTVLLGFAYALSPRGDLRWARTRVVMLDQARGRATDKQNALDVTAVRRVCDGLKKRIDRAYSDTPRSRDRTKWRLRLLISEHAHGALAIRVEGRPNGEQEYVELVERRYSDVPSLDVDVQDLAEAVVASMHNPQS